nr:hypothetical protein Iba_scaffold30205CG0020 [Ipomoea batatas]GMC72087.1 hypothetical protein Iba_scaffold33770CG0300 [Ipomoea batatas]
MDVDVKASIAYKGYSGNSKPYTSYRISPERWKCRCLCFFLPSARGSRSFSATWPGCFPPSHESAWFCNDVFGYEIVVWCCLWSMDTDAKALAMATFSRLSWPFSLGFLRMFVSYYIRLPASPAVYCATIVI